MGDGILRGRVCSGRQAVRVVAEWKMDCKILLVVIYGKESLNVSKEKTELSASYIWD